LDVPGVTGVRCFGASTATFSAPVFFDSIGWEACMLSEVSGVSCFCSSVLRTFLALEGVAVDAEVFGGAGEGDFFEDDPTLDAVAFSFVMGGDIIFDPFAASSMEALVEAFLVFFRAGVAGVSMDASGSGIFRGRPRLRGTGSVDIM
jgi:hypothetical protein